MTKTPDPNSNSTGISRRHALGLMGAGLATAALARPALAAGYPDRFITVIVPFAPGGPTDVMARVIAGPWGEALGQTIVIENRPGAGGNIGIGAAARGAPDGYNLLLTSTAFVVNPSLYKKTPYEISDFVPISNLGTSPNVFVATPASGITSVADLVKKAKAEPGKLTYASPGAGTSAHLSFELFKKNAGIDIIHVPYSGAGPAIQGILGDQVQLASAAVPPVLPHIRAGKLIAIGETGAKRWPDLPDTPSMVEAGYPAVVTENFQALFAPKGTPQDIRDKLLKTATDVLSRPDIKDKLAKAGFGVIASTPAELQAIVDREVPMWRDLVKSTGTSAD